MNQIVISGLGSVKVSSEALNELAVNVARVLPCHDSCVPSQLLLGLGRPLAHLACIDETRVHHVCRCGWLSDDNLALGHSLVHDVLHCSPGEAACAFNKQLLVRVVLGVALVVELDIVPVNQVSNFLINRYIASVRVAR